MKQHTYITDEQLWTDIEAVFAANRPARNEAEWEALTRKVSDEEIEAAKATVGKGAERKSVQHKLAWWPAIAAAAVFVIVAGLGVVFYQMKAPSDLTANVSPTDGTHESHQWDTPVPPVGHADSTSRISPHDQSHQSTQSVVPKPTCKRMMNSMRSESTSPSVETIEETINPDMELLAQQVQNIRQRGERLQRMVDAIVNME